MNRPGSWNRLGLAAMLWAACASCTSQSAQRQPAKQTAAAAPARKKKTKEKRPKTVTPPRPLKTEGRRPKTTPPQEKPPAAKTAADHALYDGATGAPAAMPAFVESSRNADLIGFGELHYHAVGSRVQLELLRALAKQRRPVALAMEFFERDTQEFLDRYLAGEITEAQFLGWSRQKKQYATSHRPLIEFCKEHGIPVIAANTPRRLVREYRKRGEAYPEFLEGLSDDERLLVPAESSGLNEDERGRFKRFMGGHGTGRDLTPFMKSMALWDDTMADSVARFRARNPRHRVLLIVGMFHVMNRMGTVRKYIARRPNDRVRTLIMVSDDDEALPFQDGDKGLGDIVLKVAPGAKPQH